MNRLDRALQQFDADAFAKRVGGTKESRSARSHEYLLPCFECGSSRLRWNTVKHAWICWGCNRTGSTLQLIERMLGLDEMAATAYVVRGYEGGEGCHANLSLGVHAPAPKPREGLQRLPLIQWPHGVERLDYIHAHAAAWIYLHKRGVGRDEANAWRLGYGRDGWLKGYLIFPVFMDDGLVYWQGRACYDPPNGERKGFKKTLNPKSLEGYASAGDVLLNYDRARTEEHVVITEGPFDAIKVGPHAVALLGKVPTPQKIARLLRMRALRFTVYLDRGDEERQYAQKLARELSAQADVYIAEPPEGADPGSLTAAQNAEVVRRPVRFKPQLSETALAH